MLEKIKELRDRTNISLAKCKLAIESSNGDIEQALVWLQKQGLTDSSKKSGRSANEGLIHSYVHMGKVGVLVEVNCETDFASRSEHFKKFVDNVALQIAAMKPEYIAKENITSPIYLEQEGIFMAQIANGGKQKPQNIIDKMIAGKLDKWYSDVCLLNHTSVVDSSKTIELMRSELVSQLGENVVVQRFVRWEVGGNSE
jgi:elongation factor Ts